MIQGIFSWVDLVMGPLYLVMLYGIAYVIAENKYTDQKLKNHFLLALTVKFIGCLGFIAVYAFYYGYGDTFVFFKDAQKLLSIIEEAPWKIGRILQVSNLDFDTLSYLDTSIDFGHATSKSSYVVTKIALVFSLLTFKSYVATSLCFAFASFIGVWCLYRTVSYIFPKYYTYVTIPILYFPSVFFWGSSIMKDSIVIGFLGLLTYSLYKLFFERRNMIIFGFIVVSCLYFLLHTKEYVIIAYMPALLFWLLIGPISRLSFKKKVILLPITVIVAGVLMYTLVPKLASLSAKYSIENILLTAESTAEYIHRISIVKGGAAYSLGEVSYTPMGLLKVSPKAIAVTLYRPSLLEANNPVMLLSALESSIILLMTIFVLLKVGIIKYFRYLFSNPFLVMCLVFSLIFAFAIGLSTYNFGSLVRYKIPCLPFYGIAIIIPYAIATKVKTN